MIISLVLVFVLGFITAKECDFLFEECDPTDNIDALDPDCFDSTKKIEDALLKGDARQAFNDCDRDSSCDKYRSEGYACVPYRTCQNNTIITSGIGLIDVRTDGGCAITSGKLDATDTKCVKIDEVCCKNPNLGDRKCDIGTKLAPEEKAAYAQCGRSSPALNITASLTFSDAQPGEYPHMCAVYRLKQGQRTYVAGASLIDKNKLVTAAHKFYIKKKGKETDLREHTAEFYVRCGEYIVKTGTELLEPQETQVEKIIIHPQYDELHVYYNLAILQTKKNFVYQKHIGPVCLPEPSQKFDKESDCWTSGWSVDVDESDVFDSDRMRKVKMPVVTSEECYTTFKRTRLFKKQPDFTIHDSWVCVGGEEESNTCKAVGGSPHVCKNSDDKWVQVGVLAWGIRCGAEVPAVYSSVAGGMCWIDWVMSCVPSARYNIDGSTNLDHLGGQGVTFQSRNKLTRVECGDWMKANRDLLNKCEVEYL